MEEISPSEELKEIINFAIESEQESMDFYNELAGKVKSQDVAKELREIADMEKGHRDRLKGIDVNAYVQTLTKPITNLRISDYIFEQKPSPEMSLQDLFNIAMHRERKATELYRDLAKLFAGPSRQLFENLAAEETSHEHHFENRWNEI